jgi:hypothetical protein
VDVGAEDLDALLLVALSSGVPVKPMNIALGRIAFMALCSLPDWVRWHSSTKTKSRPWLEVRAAGCDSDSSMKLSTSPSSLPPNLWISEQSSHSVGLVELVDQVGAALGAVDLPSSLTPLKTFSICSSSSVRSVMISTRASGTVLADPLGQPDHGQALAAALGVPDDAALALA